MKIQTSWQILFLVIIIFTNTSCYSEYSREERRVAHLAYEISGKDMFKDAWVSQNYAMQPLIKLNEYPSRFSQGDFPVNLEVPISFEVERNEHRIISGTYSGIKIAIGVHELQSDLGKTIPNLDPVLSKTPLSEIYGMTLDKVQSASSDERGKKINIYAIKTILLPDVAKYHSIRGENDHIEAFIFGKIDKGRVLADVRLKKADKGSDLITVLFRTEDDIEKNMSLVYEFLGGIKMKH